MISGQQESGRYQDKVPVTGHDGEFADNIVQRSKTEGRLVVAVRESQPRRLSEFDERLDDTIG